MLISNKQRYELENAVKWKILFRDKILEKKFATKGSDEAWLADSKLGGNICSLCCSENRIAAALTTGAIHVYHAASGKKLYQSRPHTGNISMMILTLDNLLLSASHDRTVKIHNINNRSMMKLLHILQHPREVEALSLCYNLAASGYQSLLPGYMCFCHQCIAKCCFRSLVAEHHVVAVMTRVRFTPKAFNRFFFFSFVAF